MFYHFYSRAIGSRQGSPSHEPDLNKNGTGVSGKDEIAQATNHQQPHHPPISIDGNSFGPQGVIMGDQHNFGGPGGPPGGPPGLGGTAPDHPSALLGPPFHGNEGGLGHHMMPPGGPNGGPHPPSGPSPPMQNLPPLGGHLGAGIDGMMDLQQVGHIYSLHYCI